MLPIITCHSNEILIKICNTAIKRPKFVVRSNTYKHSCFGLSLLRQHCPKIVEIFLLTTLLNTIEANSILKMTELQQLGQVLPETP